MFINKYLKLFIGQNCLFEKQNKMGFNLRKVILILVIFQIGNLYQLNYAYSAWEGEIPLVEGKADCEWGSDLCNPSAEDVTCSINNIKAGINSDDTEDGLEANSLTFWTWADVGFDYFDLFANPFEMGVEEYINYIKYEMYQHWQGIQRLGGVNNNYFVIDRSVLPDGPGKYYIVKFGSKSESDSTCLGNNSAEFISTYDNIEDKVIDNGELEVSGLWHPGGMQVVGNVLAIASEGEVDGKPKAYVDFFNVKNPEEPEKLDCSLEIDVRFEGKVCGVGITQLDDGSYLLAVNHHSKLAFYKSDSHIPSQLSNFAPNFELVSYTDEWGDGNVYDFQNINLVVQKNGRKIFLVGFGRKDCPEVFELNDSFSELFDFFKSFGLDDLIPTIKEVFAKKVCACGGKDYVCWYEVKKSSIINQGHKEFICDNYDAQDDFTNIFYHKINFSAAAGLYIGNDSQIYIYGTEHYKSGAGLNDRLPGYVKMLEFCPENVDATIGLRIDDEWEPVNVNNERIDNIKLNIRYTKPSNSCLNSIPEYTITVDGEESSKVTGVFNTESPVSLTFPILFSEDKLERNIKIIYPSNWPDYYRKTDVCQFTHYLPNFKVIPYLSGEPNTDMSDDAGVIRPIILPLNNIRLSDIEIMGCPSSSDITSLPRLVVSSLSAPDVCEGVDRISVRGNLNLLSTELRVGYIPSINFKIAENNAWVDEYKKYYTVTKCSPSTQGPFDRIFPKKGVLQEKLNLEGQKVIKRGCDVVENKTIISGDKFQITYNEDTYNQNTRDIVNIGMEDSVGQKLTAELIFSSRYLFVLENYKSIDIPKLISKAPLLHHIPRDPWMGKINEKIISRIFEISKEKNMTFQRKSLNRFFDLYNESARKELKKRKINKSLNAKISRIVDSAREEINIKIYNEVYSDKTNEKLISNLKEIIETSEKVLQAKIFTIMHEEIYNSLNKKNVLPNLMKKAIKNAK